MFGKKDDEDRAPPPAIQVQRPAPMPSGGQASTDQASHISRGLTVVGKIFRRGHDTSLLAGSRASLGIHCFHQRKRRSGRRHCRGRSRASRDRSRE